MYSTNGRVGSPRLKRARLFSIPFSLSPFLTFSLPLSLCPFVLFLVVFLVEGVQQQGFESVTGAGQR